jgi:hypothetical protein
MAKNKINHDNMSAQEAMEWCARYDGWRREPTTVHPIMRPSPPENYTYYWKHENGEAVWDGPYALTLDAAEAAFPKKWRWGRHGTWYAYRLGPMDWTISGWTASTTDTGDCIGDFWRLNVACRLAIKG